MSLNYKKNEKKTIHIIVISNTKSKVTFREVMGKLCNVESFSTQAKHVQNAILLPLKS